MMWLARAGQNDGIRKEALALRTPISFISRSKRGILLRWENAVSDPVRSSRSIWSIPSSVSVGTASAARSAPLPLRVQGITRKDFPETGSYGCTDKAVGWDAQILASGEMAPRQHVLETARGL